MWSIKILRAFKRWGLDPNSYFTTNKLQYEMIAYHVFCEDYDCEIHEHIFGEEKESQN